MGISCGAKVVKLILFVFNFLFFLFGVVCLGVGIWVLINAKSFNETINNVVKNAEVSQDISSALSSNLLNVGAGVIVALGAITFLIGFCGCCGALRESVCLLQSYSIMVSILLLLKITVAILAGVYKSKMGGSIDSELNKALTKVLKNEFDGSKSEVSLAFSLMMITFDCCGVSGPNDFNNETVWYFKANYTTEDGIYEPSNMNKKLYVPPACCKFTSKNANQLESDDPYKNMEDKTCPTKQNAATLNKVGCQQKLNDEIQKFALVLILIGVLIALVEIVGVIFACCLISSVKNQEYS